MAERAVPDIAPRLPWWWLVAPIVASAGVRGMWAPDEPRYAMIAKWIFQQREFLVLRRCGELYPDKPALVYWIAGLCGWLTGWSELAMRLVSIVSVLGVAWFTERFARRWFGEPEARWAPLLFLGFTLVFWSSGRLALDPLLTLGCVGAIYFASAPASSAREASRQTLLAGLFAGIGMFAKGPVALVNFGLPLVAWRVTRARAQGPRASRGSIAGAVALTLMPVLAWAVSASLLEPALWKPLFFGQHLQRAAEGTDHKRPPWEHLFEVPLFLLPWTVPVIAGVIDGAKAWWMRRRREAHDEGLALAFLWFLTLFVFFSVIPAKRELYLLTAYPAMALLGARRLSQRLRCDCIAGANAAVPIALFALLGLLLAAGLPALEFAATRSTKAAEALHRIDDLRATNPALAWLALGAAAPFLVGAFVAWRAFARRRYAAWASTVATTWAVGLVAVFVLIVPAVDPLKSDRNTAAVLRALPQHPLEIPCYGTAPDGVRFYDGGPCVQAAMAGLQDGDIQRHLAREGEQFLALVREDGWRGLTPETQATFAILARLAVGSREILVLGKAR